VALGEELKAGLRMRVPAWLKGTTPFYLAVAVVASAPAWIVKYPPMQDLPIHLATTRIIHSFHDPQFGFDRDFMLTLGRTEYVIYYLVGSLLAYVVGVVNANILLVSGYLGGTVLAVRALLRALGKDERACLFVVPLLVNAMFMYGLFPFLVGIPLMFWALATAVRHFERPTFERGLLLTVLALAIFYSHVFPFGIFCIGFAVMFPWGRPSRWVKSAAPAVPALLVLLWWVTFTEAGKLVRGVVTDNARDSAKPFLASVAEVHQWLTDVFRDGSGAVLFVALATLAILAAGLAQGDRDRSKPVARAYVLLPLACLVLYFTSPGAHGYIWLIAQRFPILFALCAIPLARIPSGGRGAVVFTAMIGLALASTVNTCRHFIDFQLHEVGDIDGAIAEMEPEKKVCALLYDKGSQVMGGQWVPFLHFGSYYQVKKGGVVEFTYAGYLHWPVDFQPGHYPPPGGPARQRWEWTPEQVPVQGEIYPYYDYVLTRGTGFRPPPGTYRPKWRSEDGHWTVWIREVDRGG
jgi:hypothetical protein